MADASLQNGDHVLLYLASHPVEHLKRYKELNHPILKLVGANGPGVYDKKAKVDIKQMLPDPHITVTYNEGTEDKPKYRTFTVTRIEPHSHPLPPSGVREGTFYTRGSLPAEHEVNGFWLQQYPPYPGTNEKEGRITFEFWTDTRIVGVFKTNVDNEFGALGSGEWDKNTH